MPNARRPTCATSKSYLLPASARDALLHVRDHLRLLAQLTEPQGQDCSDVVYLSAEALARCFDSLADELERITSDIDVTAS